LESMMDIKRVFVSFILQLREDFYGRNMSWKLFLAV
jgi:hypothetical protein